MRPDVLTVREQLELEDYIRHHSSNKMIGILFALYTGLRVGELCELKWEDIDLRNQTVHVRRL